MSKRRLEAVVIGPGNPGLLKIKFGRDRGAFVKDVLADRIPPELRMPNSAFVAVVSGRDFVGVEPHGEVWIAIEDRIRTILNTEWDPIGVGDSVEDEYDGYIDGIHSLLAEGATTEVLVHHLNAIEVERMGLTGSRAWKLLAVADALGRLQLPKLP
jgi:hypothetical protein